MDPKLTMLVLSILNWPIKVTRDQATTKAFLKTWCCPCELWSFDLMSQKRTYDWETDFLESRKRFMRWHAVLTWICFVFRCCYMSLVAFSQESILTYKEMCFIWIELLRVFRGVYMRIYTLKNSSQAFGTLRLPWENFSIFLRLQRSALGVVWLCGLSYKLKFLQHRTYDFTLSMSWCKFGRKDAITFCGITPSKIE